MAGCSERRGTARDPAPDHDDVEAVDRHLPEGKGDLVAVQTKGKGGTQRFERVALPRVGSRYVLIRPALGTQDPPPKTLADANRPRRSIRVLFGSIFPSRFGIRSVWVVTGQALKPQATLPTRSRTMTQILSLTRREKLSFIVFAVLIGTTFLL